MERAFASENRRPLFILPPRDKHVCSRQRGGICRSQRFFFLFSLFSCLSSEITGLSLLPRRHDLSCVASSRLRFWGDVQHLVSDPQTTFLGFPATRFFAQYLIDCTWRSVITGHELTVTNSPDVTFYLNCHTFTLNKKKGYK